MNDILADCPICKKKVTAALVRGSLDNLQEDKGDVELAHPTNDPRAGDHRWILSEPDAKASLRRILPRQEHHPYRKFFQG
jgi:hypothetical protein